MSKGTKRGESRGPYRGAATKRHRQAGHYLRTLLETGDREGHYEFARRMRIESPEFEFTEKSVLFLRDAEELAEEIDCPEIRDLVGFTRSVTLRKIEEIENE